MISAQTWRLYAILLFVYGSASPCAWSQPACSPTVFQTAYSGTLPYSSSAHTVLLRQPDGSFTAFQIANTTPYPTLSTIPNYQKALLACPSPAPVTGGTDPEAFARLKSGGYLFVQQPSGLVRSPDGTARNILGATVNVQQFDSNLHFVAEGHYPLPFSNQYVNFGSLSLADLNGDGNLDIVEAIGAGNSNGQYAYVVVLLGAGGAGFGTPAVYKVASGMSDTNATSVAIGDLNGDGKPDVAVSALQVEKPTVSVLLGNGDGKFQTERIASDATGCAQIVIADFNRDGKADLACTSARAGYVSVFLGAGDGTFSPPQQYPVAVPRTAAVALAAGDIDGDGNPDIVTSGISILFGDGRGGFPRRRDVLDETKGNIILSDFNGDGIADIVVGDGNPDVLGGQFLSVILGKGGGNFGGPPVSFRNDNGEAFVPAQGDVTADFNGDGIPDVASPTQVFTALGDGKFRTGVPLALPANCNAATVTAADFNRDGHPDLAVICGGYRSVQSIELFLNTGDGTFAAPTQTTVNLGADSILSAGPKVFLAADFNGDGKLDLALLSDTILGAPGSATGDFVFILIGHGDGTFAADTSFAAGPTPWSMAAGDFNGDGKVDLAVVDVDGPTSGANSNVSLFAGKGDGTFAAAVLLSKPPGFVPNDIAAADFDRVGKLDLAVNFASGGTGIYLGAGAGAFQPPVIYALANGTLAVGDLNGDGVPDLISGAGYLLGYGDGTFQPFTAIASAVSSLIPGDFNHDGKLDLAGEVRGFGLATFLNTAQMGAGLPLQVMSSASLSAGPVAPESLATIFGQNLAASSAAADPQNPPSTLAGASVTVQDSAGTTRSAPLLYASPDQINFMVPAGAAPGLATVTVAGAKGPQSVGVQILPVAPALFTLNSSGLPAAYLVRVTAAGVQTTEAIYAVHNGFLAPVPINLGPATDQVYLILFGTGIRGAAAGTLIPTLPLGQATYAGPQSQIPGLDQINFLLSRSVAYTGAILQLVVDGTPANTVWLAFE